MAEKILPCEGTTAAAAAQEAGRAGAPAGSAWGAPGQEGWSAALLCRPAVPMGFLEAGAACAALALAQAAGPGAQVRWPAAVAAHGDELARVTASAGFGEGGVFLVLGMEGQGALAPEPAVEAVRQAVAAWESALVAGAGAAGPWGPFLSDYFDAMELMGEQVTALAGNGLPVAAGRLAGLDGWGRATLAGPDGQEVELAPGTVRLVAAPAAD